MLGELWRLNNFCLGRVMGTQEFWRLGWILRENWKRKRGKWGHSRNKEVRGGEAQKRGWERGRMGHKEKERSLPCTSSAP